MKKFFKAILKFICGKNVTIIANQDGKIVVADRKGKFGFLKSALSANHQRTGTKLRVIRDGFETVRTFGVGSYKSRNNVAILVFNQPGTDRWLVRTKFGDNSFGVMYGDKLVSNFGYAAREISCEDIPVYSL